MCGCARSLATDASRFPVSQVPTSSPQRLRGALHAGLPLPLPLSTPLARSLSRSVLTRPLSAPDPGSLDVSVMGSTRTLPLSSSCSYLTRHDAHTHQVLTYEGIVHEDAMDEVMRVLHSVVSASPLSSSMVSRTKFSILVRFTTIVIRIQCRPLHAGFSSKCAIQYPNCAYKIRLPGATRDRLDTTRCGAQAHPRQPLQRLWCRARGMTCCASNAIAF